jgi:hypothetical protein
MSLIYLLTYDSKEVNPGGALSISINYGALS